MNPDEAPQQTDEPESNNRGLIITVMLSVGIVAFGAAYLGMSMLNGGRKPSLDELQTNQAYNEMAANLQEAEAAISAAETVEEQLKVTAAALRESLPLELDSATIMIDAQAGPGRILTYTYRLPGTNASEMNEDAFIGQMRPGLVQGYNSEAMKMYRDAGVTAVYRYTDDQEQLISEIKIEPPSQ
ncbi:MAG: hypothetical protein AAF585_15370 [Verrucomicrobiota bacterium]